MFYRENLNRDFYREKLTDIFHREKLDSDSYRKNVENTGCFFSGLEIFPWWGPENFPGGFAPGPPYMSKFPIPYNAYIFSLLWRIQAKNQKSKKPLSGSKPAKITKVHD